MRRYRIDFALIVLTGNLTRYLVTRPLVEQDPGVLARWYPIRTWVQGDFLRVLPGWLRVRVRHLLDSRMLYLRRPAQAVVIHAFETYYLYTLLTRVLRRNTVIINNPDGTLGDRLSKGLSAWLMSQAVRRTDLIVPWSRYAADSIAANYPWLASKEIMVLHPGIDLARWPFRGIKAPGERFRLLFVAGDLVLKGADTLLDAFECYLSTHCDLHLATQSGYLPADLERRIRGMPRVTLYLDLTPASDALRALFRECDAFVLPTNRDTSSWVAIEALATGLPVVISPHGGIPDIVRDEETGLHIPPRDPEALAAAVERLRLDTALRERLVTQGRAHIEQHFDAVTNTNRLLLRIKQLIDAREASQV